MNMICGAIDKAAKLCLPKSGAVANEKSKGILGWNEYVKPYQAESKFWFVVWEAKRGRTVYFATECSYAI